MVTAEDPDQLLRVASVARFFDVRPDTVREWLKENERDETKGLKGCKVNGQWRVVRRDMIAYAQNKFGANL